MAKLLNHCRKDDAVSPVVGVMLMIVVTVVIAAVVALFATNVVTSTEAAPVVVMDTNAYYSSSSDENTKVVMSMRGGDPLELSKLTVVLTESTGNYGFSVTGLDKKSGTTHLRTGEKLTVVSRADTEESSNLITPIGGTAEEVLEVFKTEYNVGKKVHVMVTFNENAIIYDKDIIVKAGEEGEVNYVSDVLGSLPGTTDVWCYNDTNHTPITSANSFTITYGVTSLNEAVISDGDKSFRGLLFKGGIKGDYVENDSCVVGVMLDTTYQYKALVNGEKIKTVPYVLQKGDVISVVKVKPYIALNPENLDEDGWVCDGEKETEGIELENTSGTMYVEYDRGGSTATLYITDGENDIECTAHLSDEVIENQSIDKIIFNDNPISEEKENPTIVTTYGEVYVTLKDRQKFVIDIPQIGSSFVTEWKKNGVTFLESHILEVPEKTVITGSIDYSTALTGETVTATFNVGSDVYTGTIRSAEVLKLFSSGKSLKMQVKKVSDQSKYDIDSITPYYLDEYVELVFTETGSVRLLGADTYNFVWKNAAGTSVDSIELVPGDITLTAPNMDPDQLVVITCSAGTFTASCDKKTLETVGEVKVFVNGVEHTSAKTYTMTYPMIITLKLIPQ